MGMRFKQYLLVRRLSKEFLDPVPPLVGKVVQVRRSRDLELDQLHLQHQIEVPRDRVVMNVYSLRDFLGSAGWRLCPVQEDHDRVHIFLWLRAFWRCTFLVLAHETRFQPVVELKTAECANSFRIPVGGRA